VQRALGEVAWPRGGPWPRLVKRLVPPPRAAVLGDDLAQGAALQVELEGRATWAGFVGVDDQLLGDHVVAEDRPPPVHAPRRRVACTLSLDAFADDLALELGERHQDVQRETARSSSRSRTAA
jgi:hypothetical protein